ncbi:type VI secretion system accessory protein TagJ [Burkholderia gladioli]|uniref:Virulence protein, SciE type n=1 Tax=Burkholderia gladioli (strain BSR3) TaxID=999541 RepID=F2LSY6_BURGS|nr:type VI secretion system accessory protein TagJ [Burkholderia gladioli]AEA66006.1 virulence protein, SciE type [Burkholderia gladioli BSR3]MBW5285038.1 ImpE/SciE family protein [Burkholderia gladioli]
MTRLTASDTPHTHRLGEAPLSEQIERVSARLRAQPTTASHRWALFQLMCVTGEWTRAVQQLQTWAKLEPSQAPTAQVYRDLIRAERWRKQVVEGRERPGFVLEPPAWVDGLLNALRFAADGQIEHADDAREAALDAAPSVAVRIPQGNAAWIVDSDSSFGPVCEVITAGHYRWVPFADLVAWRVSPPTKLVDLVWAPCTLTLVDGAIVHGFMPARYPDSETGDDAMRLGRSTVWLENGRTGITALGQKTWATDQGDFSLFELTSTEFGARIADGVSSGERVGD